MNAGHFNSAALQATKMPSQRTFCISRSINSTGAPHSRARPATTSSYLLVVARYPVHYLGVASLGSAVGGTFGEGALNFVNH